MTFIYKKKKNVYYSLLENKGLGPISVLRIYKKTGLNIRKIPKTINNLKFKRIKRFTLKFRLNQNFLKDWHLNRIFNFNLKIRKSIRNKAGLPVRGQRTQTNGKTKRKFKF